MDVNDWGYGGLRVLSPLPAMWGGELGLEDCAFGCRSDEQCVSGEDALAVVRLWRRPALQPRRHIDSIEIEAPAFDVDVDDVAISNRRQRSTHRRLRRDAPDHQALPGARKASVGHHGNRITQAFADDRRS